ncbi:putative ribonuclease H-like domain-containing protein [Tanacetum coccineum]
MEFESAHSNTTAKLPILKLGEYEMWVIRIKQYFQVQDYALWEVIENGNSWVSIPQTAQENGTSVTKMSVLVTAKEKTNKKNDVKARSLLLMALPNEHQLTFSQYNDAKTMFAAIETRFEVISQEDLNSKNLSCLPPEWNTHVKFVGASSDAQNLAFMTTPSTSSTNDTAKPAYEVSTISPNVNTASPQVSTASFSDNVVYAFMVENPNGSNLLQQDLEQIHEDDLEAMDLKWQLSLLSMRVKRECRASRNKEGQFRNQDNTRKHRNNEDTYSKAMLAIDGVGFDWSDMTEEHVQTNMALMVFSDSELNQTEFTATIYKREQLITYRKNEVLFSEEVAVLKRKVACKDYEINVLKSEFEKVKQEKEGLKFKIKKFDKASKDLDKLLGSQITDKSPEFKSYGCKDSKQESNIVCDKKSNDSKENSDDSVLKDQVSKDTSSFVEPPLNVDKETVFLADKKKEFVKPKNHEKPVKKVNYNYTTNRTHPNAQRNMVPRAVLMKTGLKPFNTARTINTTHPKSAVFINTAKAQAVNTARPKAVKTARPNSTVVNAVRGKPLMDDKGFVDSGCSRHMTRNIAYLLDFKEFDEGYVTFGGGAHGGRISGKGTLKTNSLDFEDVYFVNELKFNLFSVSQMCDKKNYVLFTDTECLVLSPNFKLPDESQILLKIPRKDNMYSFDMKNIVPKESLTCLVAKATSDESMLWHRRLGHINFKNINKLVKDNLVRGLPTKRFENDQTCVACLKGKQHKASYKEKVVAGTITNESAGTQGELNAGTSTQKEEISQDYIVMPIWKDASYFDSPSKDIGNGEPKSTTDDQKQVKDGPDNENDEKDKSEDNSSPKEVNAAGQHVNTASPEVNTGNFKLNTIDPSVSTTSSNDQDSPKDMFKLGASHTLETTHVEFFSDDDELEVDLGNIIKSYTVPTTPNTRNLKDHQIKNVIGDVKSSVQTRRMTKPTSEQGFFSAVYEQKTHDTLNTCLYACFFLEVKTAISKLVLLGIT